MDSPPTRPPLAPRVARLRARIGAYRAHRARRPGAAKPVPAGPVPTRRVVRFGLLPRLLCSILLAGLLPLLVLAGTSLRASNSAGADASVLAADALDAATIGTLQAQAQAAAARVAGVLDAAAGAARTAALLPPDPDTYLAFLQAQRAPLAYPDPTAPGGVRTLSAPLYPELAVLDGAGQEVLRIADGVLVPPGQLRDLSHPALSTYRTEDLPGLARGLARGQVALGPYTAWHQASPPASAPAAVAGAAFATYRAVIRLATPLAARGATPGSFLVLTLDARQLAEQVDHIVPGVSSGYVAWPDYASGSYAYIWDADGWLVAHPVLPRLRGLDPAGQSLPTFSAATPPGKRDQFPFNMHSDANTEAPQMMAASAAGRAGFLLNHSQVGVLKANVYAPITIHPNPDSPPTLAGGVALSTGLDGFHAAANGVRARLGGVQDDLRSQTIGLATLAVLLLAVLAWVLARSVTRPIALLTRAAAQVEAGSFDADLLARVDRSRIRDEVTRLAEVFAAMAAQVRLREARLTAQIAEMRVEVDQHKREQQVQEITDTDYFRNLQVQAQELRARRQTRPRPPRSGESTPD